MKKKTLSLFLALVLSLSLLAGCGGGDEPSNQPSDNKEPSTAQQPSDSQPADDQPSDSGKQYDGVNLTMWSMWNSDEPQGKVIQEAVAAFEEQTGAKISVEWKGRSVNEILSASLESGEKFDIFEDDYQRIANIYKDFTYDLTDMAAAVNYDSFSYACFNDTVKEWAGFLNSIAEQPQVGGIFYDKDAFSKAGVTAEPKTWTEFLDVCQKLKDPASPPSLRTAPTPTSLSITSWSATWVKTPSLSWTPTAAGQTLRALSPPRRRLLTCATPATSPTAHPTSIPAARIRSASARPR